MKKIILHLILWISAPFMTFCQTPLSLIGSYEGTYTMDIYFPDSESHDTSSAIVEIMSLDHLSCKIEHCFSTAEGIKCDVEFMTTYGFCEDPISNKSGELYYCKFYALDSIEVYNTTYSPGTAFYYKFFGKKKDVGMKDISQTAIIYPNPAYTSFMVDFANEQIYQADIFNLHGQCVKSVPVLQSKQEINVENFSNGVYFVRLITKQRESLYKKLVIIK